MVKHWFHSYLLQHYSKNKSFALDVGCAMRPYHDDYLCKYMGIDLPTRPYESLKPDIFSDGSKLPFQDNRFDLLVSYAVIPYVKNVDLLLKEMHRVLKPKGVAIIIIMNLRGLALHPETEFKNRYTSTELDQKLKERKFKSIIEKNLKAWFWSNYYNWTSVYSYAVVTPLK
jgi:SAM-dependent methyltransferase